MYAIRSYYDSFNAALVRRMPWLSRFGAVPEIAEDPRPLYREAVRRLLHRITSYNVCYTKLLRDFILKWNPRGQSKTLWHRRAFSEGTVSAPRPGKPIAVLTTRDTHTWTDEETGEKRELRCRRA